MEKELEKWDKKLWETRGARFNASRRLNKKNDLSMRALIWCSGYVFFFSVIPALGTQLSFLNNDVIVILSILSIVLSFLVFGFSLVISANDYKLKANKYHECGREIGALLIKISRWKEMKKDVSEQEMEQIAIDYKDILDKSDLNHDTLDFDLFKVDNYSIYKKGMLFKFFVRIKYYFSVRLIYDISIGAPILVYFIWKIFK